jgi:hypothetical protein
VPMAHVDHGYTLWHAQRFLLSPAAAARRRVLSRRSTVAAYDAAMISTFSSVIERFGRAGFEPVRCSFVASVEKKQGSRHWRVYPWRSTARLSARICLNRYLLRDLPKTEKLN